MALDLVIARIVQQDAFKFLSMYYTRSAVNPTYAEKMNVRLRLIWEGGLVGGKQSEKIQFFLFRRMNFVPQSLHVAH